MLSEHRGRSVTLCCTFTFSFVQSTIATTIRLPRHFYLFSCSSPKPLAWIFRCSNPRYRNTLFPCGIRLGFLSRENQLLRRLTPDGAFKALSAWYIAPTDENPRVAGINCKGLTECELVAAATYSIRATAFHIWLHISDWCVHQQRFGEVTRNYDFLPCHYCSCF